MYLTIRMKLENGEDFLEKTAMEYTKAIADVSEAMICGNDTAQAGSAYSLSDGVLRKVNREARRRCTMVKEKKIPAEEPITEHCVFPHYCLSLDLPRRVIRLSDRGKSFREVLFRTDHYRMILMNESRPLSFKTEMRDGNWYGWLLCYITEEKYRFVREFLKEEKTGLQKTGQDIASFSTAGSMSM